MNITVLANRDLASNIALNYLFSTLPNHQYRLFLSAHVGKQTSRPAALQDLAFVEQQLFNDIVFPIINKQSNDNQTTLNSFEHFNSSGITVGNIEKINSKEGTAKIAATKADLIVSIRFGQILQAPVIALPTFGVLNLHSGILPDFRGVMACFWSMLKQRNDIGTTLHYIDDGKIDKGAIVSIQKQPVDYQKSYLTNLLSIYSPGIDSLANAIQSIEAGSLITPLPQNECTGAYYTFPTESDLQAFRDMGYRLYDYDDIAAIAKRYI